MRHEETDVIRSVTGVLIAVTRRDGPHVIVRGETSGRAVRCSVNHATLRQAARWIGAVVVATGNVRPDFLGGLDRIANASVDLESERDHVTVAEMGGVFQGGPESVAWLRDQRGR